MIILFFTITVYYFKNKLINDISLVLHNNTSKLQSQDPSAFLKEVLKISDDNTLINLPTKSSGTSANKNQSQNHKSSDAPPLVQKLFDVSILFLCLKHSFHQIFMIVHV